MASTPTGASQRLLTMKFMQRAAAAQAPASPSTPASNPDDSRPHKRAKLGRGLNKAEEASFVIDQNAAQAALQDEDRQRQAAMDRMAERLGDSHWVLDTAKLPSSHKQAGTPLKIVQVGFSEIDKRGESEEAQEQATRAFQSYGPKKKAQKGKREKAGRSPAGQTSGGADVHLQDSQDSDSDSSSSDSESDSDSDNSDSDSSSEEPDKVSQSKPGRAIYGSQKRDELKRKKRAEQAKSKRMASDRKKKEVNLHRLTSISGGGIAPKRPGPRR